MRSRSASISASRCCTTLSTTAHSLALELTWGGSPGMLGFLHVRPSRPGAQLMTADGYALSGRRALTLAEEPLGFSLGWVAAHLVVRLDDSV
ncbi:unnamed protein product [Peniophora sp. CBMAI 1063]|nr:unnamed protein product [Peniophora sp. CBMAI 1063]